MRWRYVLACALRFAGFSMLRWHPRTIYACLVREKRERSLCVERECLDC